MFHVKKLADAFFSRKTLNKIIKMHNYEVERHLVGPPKKYGTPPVKFVGGRFGFAISGAKLKLRGYWPTPSMEDGHRP